MSGRRILVVDDEQDVLESTCMLLSSMGWEPVPLADPGDVLPAARREQPALILQDLRMPRMNIAGMVAALRSHPETATIPIVFFSANADLAATARRYDVWGSLRKPFTAAQLQEVVEKAVQGQGFEASGVDLRKAIRDIFHEQWNAFAAVSNYAHMLRSHGDEEGQRIAGNLEGQLLRLEASTDRLHAFVAALADRAEAGEQADAASREAAGGRPPRPPRQVPSDARASNARDVQR